MNCWVYVLQSQKDSRVYVGITSNLRRRIKEHNAGRNRSTSGGEPYALVLKEPYEDHQRARLREKFLKSGQGRAFLKSLLRSQPAEGG